MTSDFRPGVAQAIDELDRRLISALQIDGRASWLRIARALHENERTVARRGVRLLASGVMRVTGVQLKANGTILALRCNPGHARMCSRAISGRPETMWSHMAAGTDDIVAEVNYSPAQETTFLLEELPALPGLRSSATYPVLRYLRTAHQWRPGVLSDAECEALESGMPMGQRLQVGELEGLSSADRLMHAALVENGRRSYEELARLAGVSEVTARRRIDQMRQNGQLVVRAVVDPAVLGLPIKALIWVRTAPRELDALTAAVETTPRIRYASRITGPYQVLIAVDLASRVDLEDFVSRAQWAQHADAIDVSVVVATGKRGGLLSDALQ
jgi:DNA-binding Lrp family transcriptional regulator